MRRKKERGADAVIITVIVVMALLIGNISYLSLTGKHLVNGSDVLGFSQSLGGGQKSDVLYASRGTIYSSDNAVIASDVKKYKLIAYVSESRMGINNQPAYVEDKEACAEKLSKIIGLDKSKILARLNAEGAYQVEFGSYGNNLSSTTKEKIEELDIPGLEFEEVINRNYRFGDFASYEIGYVSINVENNLSTIVGEMGIEKLYNDELTGTNGSKVYLADSSGNVLPNGIINETAPVAGNDIYLTIDSELQTELDMQLSKLGKTLKVEKATCGIMEAKTGRILAISNYPSFDPNDRELDNYTDIFFVDTIEPGSVFKPFVYANGINDGVLDLDATYSSGKFYYNNKVTIKDHNDGTGWGTITFEEGFYHSSNTAICNILSKYTKKESLIQDYNSLGFFQASTIDRIASSNGIAGYARDSATQLEYLTTGFGQGSTVTALQLMRAYSVFANDGKTVEPYLVDKIVNSETDEEIYTGESSYSDRIYSSDTVKTMLKLMYGVVNKEGSTGYMYHMDDIDLVGKTGTGQVVVDGAYSSSLYTHSFAGLAPYNDPEIIIVLWYQDKNDDSEVRADFVKSMTAAALSAMDAQPTKTVETSSYVLDSYLNQNTSYVKDLLKSHSLTPIIIGDGKTVIDQYPQSKTQMTKDSRVYILTNGSTIKMPSMKGWSRKEAEAFASMANVTLKFDGVGTVYKQSVSKGETLKQNQEITVYAK